jgi:hypothetical protein
MAFLMYANLYDRRFSCTVLTDYRCLASSLRLPPHPLYSLSLVSHRFSAPDCVYGGSVCSCENSDFQCKVVSF